MIPVVIEYMGGGIGGMREKVRNILVNCETHKVCREMLRIVVMESESIPTEKSHHVNVRPLSVEAKSFRTKRFAYMYTNFSTAVLTTVGLEKQVQNSVYTFAICVTTRGN